MKWTPDGPCAIKSEGGQFLINRAPQHGHVPKGGTITFTLVDHFAHEVIDMRRDVPARAEAIREAVDALKLRAMAHG